MLTRTSAESLVNLEWLDLSFNKIERIQNLGAQTRLKVLALFNNRIVEIENVEHLQELGTSIAAGGRGAFDGFPYRILNPYIISRLPSTFWGGRQFSFPLTFPILDLVFLQLI